MILVHSAASLPKSDARTEGAIFACGEEEVLIVQIPSNLSESVRTGRRLLFRKPRLAFRRSSWYQRRNKAVPYERTESIHCRRDQRSQTRLQRSRSPAFLGPPTSRRSQKAILMLADNNTAHRYSTTDAERRRHSLSYSFARRLAPRFLSDRRTPFRSLTACKPSSVYLLYAIRRQFSLRNVTLEPRRSIPKYSWQQRVGSEEGILDAIT